MEKKFLITRPKHDLTMKYLHQWSGEILKFAKKRNIDFSDFEGENANRENVQKFLKKQKPKLVVFNGHGNPKMICGHNNKPLIVSDKNEEFLESKISYAISCDAASDLGLKIVKKGGETFIGYEGPFGFVRDGSRECNPSKDKLAKPFKKVSNTIIKEIIKGKSVEKSIKKSKKTTSELLKKYSLEETEPGHKEIRFWLFWNRHFLRIFGNSEAKFK